MIVHHAIVEHAHVAKALVAAHQLHELLALVIAEDELAVHHAGYGVVIGDLMDIGSFESGLSHAVNEDRLLSGKQACNQSPAFLREMMQVSVATSNSRPLILNFLPLALANVAAPHFIARPHETTPPIHRRSHERLRAKHRAAQRGDRRRGRGAEGG